MSDQQAKPPSANGYIFVPAKSVNEADLIEFTAAIWPDRPRDQLLSRWWRRAEPTCAVAAIHEATGVMAGFCGGRPSEWVISGQSTESIAICDWYVAPGHMGKGIGKRLVQHFEMPDRLLYAFSVSEAAIANFKKLGWKGPHAASLMVLPLPRLIGLPLAVLEGRSRHDLRDQVISAGGLGLLGPQLDHIETNRNHDAPAHMRRGANEWSWRLSVCGERNYHFCVAHLADEPVGYVVVRRLTGSSRKLARFGCAIVTDLVAVNDDLMVLRALAARAAAIAANLRTVACFATTTIQAQRTSLASAGFVSPDFPLLGRLLRRLSPQFMWAPRGPASQLTPSGMALSFADSDLDLFL